MNGAPQPAAGKHHQWRNRAAARNTQEEKTGPGPTEVGGTGRDGVNVTRHDDMIDSTLGLLRCQVQDARCRYTFVVAQAGVTHRGR